MRVAALDVGSNSVRLLVAENAVGRPRPVASHGVVTRLAEGYEQTGKLPMQAIARTAASVAEMRGEARKRGAVMFRAVATGVVRDCDNKEDFLAHVREVSGVELELLSGKEEARLCLLGAWSSLGLGPGTQRLVDVGGGTTEIVEGSPNHIDVALTLPLGCVTLTEAHLRSDPPTPGDLATLREEAASRLALLGFVPRRGKVIATGGTATTLASLELSLERYSGDKINGHWLGKETLRRISARLASLSYAQRRRVRGLSPERADIIVAGTIVLEVVLEQWGAGGYVVSDGGLRHGMVVEMLGLG